jgi:DNA invertase Pin-like site-specific DNA recombinase
MHTATPVGLPNHCLQSGGTDLTSRAGRMVMRVIGAIAEFERDLSIERTQAGLERAGDLPLSEIFVHGPPVRSLATEP